MKLLLPAARRKSLLSLVVLSSLFAVPANLCPIETSLASPGTRESAAVSSTTRPQSLDNTAVAALKPGETIKREIAGGELHAYRITVGQGQYARIQVEQQGMDLKVRLLDINRKLLAQSDNPNGKYGPEFISIIAEAAGDYLLEVSSSNKWAPRGSYQLVLEEPREPAQADKDRADAERLSVEVPASQDADQRQQAIDANTKALPLWKSLGDRRGEAYALCNLGSLYRAKGELATALDYFAQARALLKEAGDAAGQAYVLNERGAAQRALGDPLKTLEDYDQALELRRVAGDKWGEAQILNNIGLAYSRARQHSKGISYYEQALALWRETGDRNQEVNTLNNLAGALKELGQSQTALDYFKRALEIWRQLGVADKVVTALNNIGEIYDTWGDWDEAHKHYGTALSLTENDPKKRAQRAQTLENLGMLYAGLGKPQDALDKFNESLGLRNYLNEPGGIASSLNKLGYAYSLLGDYDKALDNYKKALERLSGPKVDRHLQAYTLTMMGAAYYKVGDLPSALKCYQQAREIETGLEDPSAQALVFTKLGETYTALGRLPEAIDSYRQALPLWQKITDRRGEAQAFYGIAFVERARNNPEEARAQIEKGIDVIESLRTKVTSRQLRISYLARQQDYYELDVDVRMQLYRRTGAEEHLAAALQAHEKSRARSLLDTLAEAHVNIYRGASPALLQEKRTLERQLNDSAERLMILRRDNRKVDADAVEANLNKLMERYDQVQTQIRTQNPASAGLAQGRPLSLREIQQALDEESVMLEYALGGERSYLWAVSRNSVAAYQLPSRAEIEKLVSPVRETLLAPQSIAAEAGYARLVRESEAQYWRRAAELSDKIVGPAAAQLGNRKLLIVPDGALHYISFAALPFPVMSKADETRAAHAPDAAAPITLGSRHEIVYEQSASVIVQLRERPRKPAPKEVIVMADPVFNSRDRRVQQRGKTGPPEITAPPVNASLNSVSRDVGVLGEQLSRLDTSSDEAKEIVALAPPGKGAMLVGFAASRNTATSEELSRYRIVHFATHSVLDDRHPEFSGIVLSLVDERGRSQNGFLRLQDIYDLSLPVDMVVLSACQTGTGKEVRGEGIISLTRGFMSAGTSRVVASLWKVDTDATADLMKRFYRKMLREGVAPPAALKAAQEEVRAQPLWRSPYYWAGFILQGEWR
jgi:CHAT domain-containing protein